MRARVLWSIALVSMAVNTGGCTPRSEVRPAGGVDRIDREASAIVDGIEAWRIDTQTELSIGSVDGEAPYRFSDVAGAVRISDRIIVADAATLDLRYFDLEGLHRLTVGQGEFRSLEQLSRCEGDLAYAFDYFARVVQIRNSQGELIREVSTIEPGIDRARRPYTMECSSESEGFAAIGWGDLVAVDLSPGTVPRHLAPAWITDEEGQVLVSLGDHLSSERVVTWNAATQRAMGSAPHPFGRATVFALSPGELFVSSGEAYAIDVYSRDDGAPLRQILGPESDLAITSEMTEAYRAASLDEHAERVRRSIAAQGLPMPESLPAITALRIDAEGAIWVRRFGVPGAAGERWEVFGANESFLGEVVLPDRVKLLDIGPDWILGLATDELGTQRVNQYRLIRG